MVTCHLANSYIDGAAREAGAVAEMAAVWKDGKYGTVEATCIFLVVAMETLGILSEWASQFFQALGQRISQRSGDTRETAFVYQRLSVLVQHFNAILLHDSLLVLDCVDWLVVPFLYFFNF